MIRPPLAGHGNFKVVAVLGTILTAGACSKAPVKPMRPAISVAVVPVRKVTLPYTLEANGIVTPIQTAAVASQVDGIILDVAFAEGSEVAKGQVLFKIEPHQYQAAYDAAVAALARDRAMAENAKKDYDRYELLRKSNVVTAADAELKAATAASAQATVDADNATVSNAKFNLENTTVRAPISGRTGSLLVRGGNLVHAGASTPLVVINQVRPIYVRFAVPGSMLPLVLQYGGKGGLPVTAMPNAASSPAAPKDTTSASMDAGQKSSLQTVAVDPAVNNPDGHGVQTFIDNAVDTTTGTVQLRAKFANAGGTLWAGQFMSVSMRLFDEKDALVVPSQCVVTGQRGTYVYVVDSASLAALRMVAVERTANGLSVISSGLSEGERVVSDGQSRLTPGAPVDLRSGKDSAGAAGRGGRGGGRGGRGRGKAPTP
ncbi:MAG TPA: efflux RND transporter periplasmic adaptor subunit [Gemmatimonadaceae bacterium]|jgi:multidrug efflux system membrane fusion protein